MSESICEKCGWPNVTWFAPNVIWNAVAERKGQVLCPMCFIKGAEAAGFKQDAWLIRPEFWYEKAQRQHKFRMKSCLAWIGATMAGCLISTGLILWMWRRPDEAITCMVCSTVMLWGGWGIHFLIFHKKRTN